MPYRLLPGAVDPVAAQIAVFGVFVQQSQLDSILDVMLGPSRKLTELMSRLTAGDRRLCEIAQAMTWLDPKWAQISQNVLVPWSSRKEDHNGH